MSSATPEEANKNRFETFIDAILAIIMTILVLEFKVPESAFESDKDLKSHLYHLAPSVFSYLLSFATIVALWMDHHNLFRLIKKLDTPLIFLNFIFILFLSATPFTTSLAGRNHESSFAVAIVGFNYLLMNLSFSSIFMYVLQKKNDPGFCDQKGNIQTGKYYHINRNFTFNSKYSPCLCEYLYFFFIFHPCYPVASVQALAS